MAPCTCRTMRCTSSPRLVLPNSEIVATAPWTTSIFMMKMKNRMSAVEQAKNPQKILRAKASRNVSSTSATVMSSDLLLIDGPHENLFEGARRARHGLYGAMLGAQPVHRLVRLVSAGEEKLDITVALGHGPGLRAQLTFQQLRHLFGFYAIAAAGRQVLHFSLERHPAAVNDGHIPAEQLDFSQ